ncbi:FAD binding domain protein [Xylaria venustula]|nr:FAD binding domain protein [Xylaria venustula]
MSLWQPRGAQCRCFPGDECWPSAADWASLNQSAHGALIATVPIASPCHDTFRGIDYDAKKCAYIQANWPRPELHEKTAHSPMAAIFANMSCDLFTPREAQLNASSATDYQKTIAFAKSHNIRLVIRNTGHDYLGKSTGAGALALWTHYIIGIDILGYSSPSHTGKAMRVGAGVLEGETQRVASAQGCMVVEGDCETVGIAGGYTQGGGTSPLASKFGLAADQVLEWEVVTADGTLLTATPTQHSDLYWALSGGGGGTYGAVVSMTVKLHKSMPTGSVTLSFAEATETYFPNGTAGGLMQLLHPTPQALNNSAIQYASTQQDFPTFQGACNTLNPTMNITAVNLGGHIIPRTFVSTEDSASSLINAIRSISSNMAVFAGVSMDVHKPPTFPNAVNPAWRDSVFLAQHDEINYTANIVAQAFVNNVLSPPLQKLTPEGSAYLNEANFEKPNWQQLFYGDNYGKLVSTKKKYDPDDMFWGKTAVGSEAWDVASDGKLCKT